MQLNDKNFNSFNDKHKAIFQDLRLVEDIHLWLNGSFPTTFFASDIDLYAKMPMSQYEKLCQNLAKFLYSELPSYLFFTELKIGKTKTQNLSRTIELLLLESQQPQLINDGNNWVKLDFIALIGGYYEEITIIYDFGNSMMKPLNEVIKGYEKDIKKYSKGKNKNMFKVLKRLIGLTRVTNQPSKSKKLTKKLNNSDVGFIYLTLARLEALKNVKDSNRKQKMTVLNNLKETVIIQLKSMFPELKVSSSEFKMSNIDKIQKKLLKVMNDELKKSINVF